MKTVWTLVVGGLCLLAFVALTSCCKPIFVKATPRVVGESTSQRPNAGYLRVEITSNLNAFQRPEYSKVAKGFKYLSVGVTILNVGEKTAFEYPLLLLDLEGRKKEELTDVNIAQGEYVNFESSMQPVLDFSIRAIPQTVAGSYAVAFKKLQSISSGLPLSQLTGNNPYLSIAGQLLSNIADEANSSNKQTLTTAKIGLSGSTAHSSPFPLDGTPIALFLQPDDVSLPLPEPQTLKLCANNPAALCLAANNTIANSVEEVFEAFPYLIIRASTAEFRPTVDWAGHNWSCELGEQPEKMKEMERALYGTRFTREQEQAELKMLERVQLLSKAYKLRNKFDIEQADELAEFASLLNAWRFVSLESGVWAAHEALVVEMERCFQREMLLRNESAVSIFRYAFEAVSAFWKAPRFEAPLESESRRKLEMWLKDIKAPAEVLNLKSGEVYGSLRATQDSIEALLLTEAQTLAEKLVDAKARTALYMEVDERLADSPCEGCRAVLNEAVAQTNLMGASPEQQNSTLIKERSRRKFVEARQHAKQMARIADTLQLASPTENAETIKQLSERIVAAAQVNPRTSNKAALDKAREELEAASTQLRNKLLEANAKP